MYPKIISPYLTSVDQATNEIYVLHREDPQFLVWVKQEVPVRFVLIETYDCSLSNEELLAHPSVQGAKDYVSKLFQNSFDKN
ncbi:hypothetical protein [Wenyingzhuangia sp. 2_MG-2023]|uniref:hypothetical protein n=1 Tax=Wenyingzhuangia sp. 2_MG-2023 TaxID=3062639 RepID=UPI0026E1761B|nr:hypothetical protein [Wenyingzhuangia sp. 2_MG-2023]MDO6737054.1 hypothetical protein [Wenyingzhuangia sp. 2_MG-2023]